MNMATARTNENLARYTEYLFDNASERAKTRLSSLSALYDAHTIHHLNQRGIDEGWSCLEVGGGGSITSWLCARMGAAGRVVTMDIEPRFLQALSFPNLDVCRQGSPEEPPPTGEFNLGIDRPSPLVVHVSTALEDCTQGGVLPSAASTTLRENGWPTVAAG